MGFQNKARMFSDSLGFFKENDFKRLQSSFLEWLKQYFQGSQSSRTSCSQVLHYLEGLIPTVAYCEATSNVIKSITNSALHAQHRNFLLVI